MILSGCGTEGSNHTPPQAPTVVSAQTTLAPGQRAYRHCMACHGMEGQGIPGLYPPLVGSDLLAGEPTYGVAMILNGLGGSSEWSGKMIPLGDIMSDEDIAAVLAWTRQEFAGLETDISADFVQKIRAQVADGPYPLTRADLTALTAP